MPAKIDQVKTFDDTIASSSTMSEEKKNAASPSRKISLFPHPTTISTYDNCTHPIGTCPIRGTQAKSRQKTATGARQANVVMHGAPTDQSVPSSEIVFNGRARAISCLRTRDWFWGKRGRLQKPMEDELWCWEDTLPVGGYSWSAAIGKALEDECRGAEWLKAQKDEVQQSSEEYRRRRCIRRRGARCAGAAGYRYVYAQQSEPRLATKRPVVIPSVRVFRTMDSQKKAIRMRRQLWEDEENE
ncbi:hypothetical protein BJ912DRAFT_929893 [Pholiota molesta]|nr:hypothetical protein BJ912DRAFT_929893 [Pholiota molesta]